MRLRPASWAAAQKPSKERRWPGAPSDVVLKRTASVPKKSARAAAAAPLKVLWPEVYEGNGGVVSSGRQSGWRSVSGLPPRSASRTAVIGRQKSYLNLHSQQQTPASARQTLSSANS